MILNNAFRIIVHVARRSDIATATLKRARVSRVARPRGTNRLSSFSWKYFLVTRMLRVAHFDIPFGILGRRLAAGIERPAKIYTVKVTINASAFA